MLFTSSNITNHHQLVLPVNARQETNVGKRNKVESYYIKIVPNVNSLVGSPDTERAAIKADGPGTGVTATFSLTHIFTCN